MRLLLIVLVVFAVLLTGCSCEEMPAGEPIAPAVQEQTGAQEQVAAQKQGESVKQTNETGEATVQGDEQLALVTDSEENVTILSDISCEFENGQPKRFSFKVMNDEQKEWLFSTLSYDDMEMYDHPIVVLNALQVTDAQMISACGRKSIQPGQTAVCNFDLAADMKVSRSLRTGLTPLGNENKNTLTINTVDHAAELEFICE